MYLPSITLGLTAVMAACFSASFAAVYFEMILKRNANNTYGITSAPTSMWMRNIQLTLITVLISLAKPISKHLWRVGYLDTSLEDDSGIPLLQGFTIWTWALVGLQAIGGLLVIAVIGYTDNVLRGMAMVISQVTVMVLSFLLFSTAISEASNFGALTILLSVYYFSDANNYSIFHQEEDKETTPYRIRIV